MGEMSKIEEVARAIWASGHGIPWEMADVPDRLDCLYASKAAIEAMRGPTEAMLEAGTVVDDDFSEAAPERACFMIYHAMLDAALKE